MRALSLALSAGLALCSTAMAQQVPDTASARPMELLIEEAVVEETRSTQQLDRLSSTITTKISVGEFQKGACCNLSESFETTPGIDALQADAVTGQKRIQMLGLAGSYTQVQLEGVPHTRGLSAASGLSYLPGPWVEGIQLTRGASSVTPSAEGMAGQINVELFKPLATAKQMQKDGFSQWYLNGYLNPMGRLEANAIVRGRVAPRWHSALLAHANGLPHAMRMDVNKDAFADIPAGRGASMLWRNEVTLPKGWHFQAHLLGQADARFGGQLKQAEPLQAPNVSLYEANTGHNRLQVWSKLGGGLGQRPYKSIGLITSYTAHQQQASYGLRRYAGHKQSGYVNLIYRTAIGNTNRMVLMGATLQADRWQERLEGQAYAGTGPDTLVLKHQEVLPGLYAELNWKLTPVATLVAGIRAERSDRWGYFVTPRLQGSYRFNEKLSLRLTAGRGRRIPALLAEAQGWLVSSRRIEVVAKDGRRHQGFVQPEQSWNMGTGLFWEGALFTRAATITLDGFYTRLTNAWLPDAETPGLLRFYQSPRPVEALALQAQVDAKPIRRMDVRLGYRLADTRAHFMTVGGAPRLLLPQMARHRWMANVAYAFSPRWSVDATISYASTKRLVAADPQGGSGASPAFTNLLAQVTYKPSRHVDIYLGGEDLLGQRQANPILGANDPFGPGFDAASQVWGPVIGRMVYLGFRIK